MSKTKNKYFEISNELKLVISPAKKKNVSKLHDIFKQIDGYKHINDNLIYLNDSNGNKKIFAIFSLTTEGNSGDLSSRRIQYQHKMIAVNNKNIIPNCVIGVYQHNDIIAFTFAFATNFLKKLIHKTKSITTLYRIKIEEIHEMLKNSEKIVKKIKTSKNGTFNLYITKDLNVVINFEKIPNINKSSDDHLDTLLEMFKTNKKIKPSESRKKEIGYKAEKIVYKQLREGQSNLYKILKNKLKKNITNITWQNKEKEKFKPYDISLNHDNFFIEVKGSTKTEIFDFFMSDNEKQFSYENKNNYFLIKLNELDTEKEIFKDFNIYKYKEINEHLKPTKWKWEKNEK